MSASNSTLYGTGVFTTIRIVEGKPWLWEKHWRRLEQDAAKVGIDISSYSEYMIRRGLDESIPDSDRIRPHKARITIADERPSPLWSEAAVTIATKVTFLASPLRPAPEQFRIGVSPHPLNSSSPLAGVKSCNYLDPIMSLDEASARGFHEAIRANERGYVTSGCMANVFWAKSGRLYTPSVATGCLAGTTREFVLENVECCEVEAGIDELHDADAIFLTSAGLGVTAAAEFDEKPLSKPDHPILHLIPTDI